MGFMYYKAAKPKAMIVRPRVADFTRDISSKFVKRGLRLLLKHCTTLLLLPVLGFALVSTMLLPCSPRTTTCQSPHV